MLNSATALHIAGPVFGVRTYTYVHMYMYVRVCVCVSELSMLVGHATYFISV